MEAVASAFIKRSFKSSVLRCKLKHDWNLISERETGGACSISTEANSPQSPKTMHVWEELHWKDSKHFASYEYFFKMHTLTFRMNFPNKGLLSFLLRTKQSSL